MSGFWRKLCLISVASVYFTAASHARADDAKAVSAPPAVPVQAVTALKYPDAKPVEKSYGKEKVTAENGVVFYTRNYREYQDGATYPGYSADVDFIRIESRIYPYAAEMKDYINAQLIDELSGARAALIPYPKSDDDLTCSELTAGGNVPFCGDDSGMEMGEVHAVGSIASARYIMSSFPTGAQHPNYHIVTYNFSLDPLIRLTSPEVIFIDSGKAFAPFQQLVRDSLLSRKDSEGNSLLDKDWVGKGTGKWEDFSAFMLKSDGVAVYFDPYAVSSFADGVQEADIPYSRIKTLLLPFYRNALGLDK